MVKALTAEELLAGASSTHAVRVPANLLNPNNETNGLEAGELVLRPLTVRDVQRVTMAAREQQVLTSVLMVQQALVNPKLTIEQVGALPAGLVQFLLAQVNKVSGLSLDGDDLETAIKAPLTRACFILSREFGWTPAQCSELTVGQVLLYLEMLARNDAEGVQL
ncbi:MAG TPA: hypothetical protein VF290_20840 [Pyrinomonadaceae bacterium]